MIQHEMAMIPLVGIDLRVKTITKSRTIFVLDHQEFKTWFGSVPESTMMIVNLESYSPVFQNYTMFLESLSESDNSHDDGMS